MAVERGSTVLTIFALLVLFISGSFLILFTIMLTPEMRNWEKAVSVQQLKKLAPHTSSEELEEVADESAKIGQKITVRGVIYCTLIFISGIAILIRRNWGRLLFLLVAFIGFISNSVGLFIHRAGVDKSLIPSIILSVLFTFGSLFYLTRPKVKEQFK